MCSMGAKVKQTRITKCAHKETARGNLERFLLVAMNFGNYIVRFCWQKQYLIRHNKYIWCWHGIGHVRTVKRT